ncbi:MULTISPECIES: class A beta-lactamase [Streptomyces]|uniref:Beta-lactamase n=2 Tax=Streptomyces TaxID=1883 RepID=A0A101QJT1_STRCK|nr:class A beta-lactamase [Streptomyces corchorusii]AEY93532.1 beta-lactamase precursor [Streptomyces hygroscopicus subsp. jinggangensis 5008]AGF67689.1 beta-lactamase precursor [Streptomyces hygroscopicus subsp. jinggangensis TL01]KUN31148.1 class A beta-lactamase [Streptomyces corchorusii]
MTDLDRPTRLPRRRLIKAGLALTGAAVTTTALSAPAASASPDAASRAGHAELAELERRYGARLGVYARNVRTGRTVSHRAGERFAMCSTFKAFAAAAVLRDRAGCAPLDRVVHYPPHDLLPNSPRTEENLATGMTVADLCAAAIQYSDNAAGNLLLRELGGPAGLTRFYRSLGDEVSRLDRWEPELNTAVPGDPRDTTTPEAIAASLERVTLGRALARADRERFVGWLKGNTTSSARFRKGLPKEWVVADKTGTGDYATANDIGVAWTTRRTPVVLAVLSGKSTPDAPVDEALIADAAAVVARTLAPGE